MKWSVQLETEDGQVMSRRSFWEHKIAQAAFMAPYPYHFSREELRESFRIKIIYPDETFISCDLSVKDDSWMWELDLSLTPEGCEIRMGDDIWNEDVKDVLDEVELSMEGKGITFIQETIERVCKEHSSGWFSELQPALIYDVMRYYSEFTSKKGASK